MVQGDNVVLHKIYEQALRRKNNMSQTKMGAHISVSSTGEDGFLPSQKDIELFEMIDMIIKKNLPLSIVEDTEFR